MPKRKKLEEQLHEIHLLKTEDPTTPDFAKQVKGFLQAKSNLLTAAAAELVGERELQELVDLLPPAFDRVVEQGPEKDKGCRAKKAIASALLKLGAADHHVFERGIKIVQPERGFGESQDTAAELRGICALGLVSSHYPNVNGELAVLLADEERNARLGAARAIGSSGRGDGIPLLRFKLLCGDADQEVMLECFDALLALSSDFDFVASFLDAPMEDTVEAAALALGQSRNEEALKLLVDWLDQQNSHHRIVLLAVALMRIAPAIDYLMGKITAEERSIGALAIEALGTYHHDAELRERVQQAVSQEDHPSLHRAFQDAFPA